MKARTKFLLLGLLVLSTAGWLMTSSIKSTGMYYLTTSELAAKVDADSTFLETGIKVGAYVVPGTIVREPGGKALSFTMTDGTRQYPVHYRGIAPDTFTDGDSIEVVVEGRLGQDGVFRATTLLAKCASRYEAAPGQPGQPGYGQPGYGRPEGETKPYEPVSAPKATGA